jgi:hypothetical protein
VREDQQGLIKGAWGRTEKNRKASYCAITKSGEKALFEETQRWRQITGLMEKFF